MTTGNKYLDYLILILGVSVISLIILRLLRFSLDRYIKKSSEQINVDPTQYYFLKNALSFIIFFFATIVILFAIPELKQIGMTLFAGAGIIAAIIGFASQAAFSNIINGIFIVIFKPFRVGDIVKVSNQYFGIIEDITLRHTMIRDMENKRYIIPNAVIGAEVVHNFSILDEKVSNLVYFGISYSSSIDRAMEIFREEAENHPLTIDGRSEQDIIDGKPMIIIRVMGWGESSIDLRATIWSKDAFTGFEIKTDLYKSVKARFDQEGIEIPFPHRTVYMRD